MEEEHDSLNESPAMRQVQQIIQDVKHYEILYSARPGQTVIGEYDERGFHATGLAGEFTLSIVPDTYVTRVMDNIKKKCLMTDNQLCQMTEDMAILNDDWDKYIDNLLKKNSADLQ